jgi:long-chain fatty acid transport protein
MKTAHSAVHLAMAVLYIAFGSVFCANAHTGDAAAMQLAQARGMLLAWQYSAGDEPVDGNQVAAGARAITPDFEFDRRTSSLDSAWDYGNPGLRGSKANTFFYAHPLSKRTMLGLGIGTTGLDFPSGLRSFTLAPSLAYSLNDRLLLSVRLDTGYFYSARANEFNQYSDCVALEEKGALPLVTCSDAIQYLPANLARSRAGNLDADGWAYGYNLGAMLMLGEDTHVGMRYRSGMALNLEDETVFHTAGPLLSTDLAQLTDPVVIAGLGLPESFAVGASHQFNERWSIAGDVTWVNWSQFDRLHIVSEGASQSRGVTTEDWKNTYRYTLGMNYRQNDQWKYRLGAAYDQSPIPGGRPGAALFPSEDRIWLAFGVGYSPTPRLSLDVGYAYAFFMDSHLYNGLRHNLAGQFEGEGDILSAQFKWRFE